jgi:hypothetical protein
VPPKAPQRPRRKYRKVNLASQKRPVALEHVRRNYWHLWKMLKEAETNAALEKGWRRAPEGSTGWRKVQQLQEALRLLEEVSD